MPNLLRPILIEDVTLTLTGESGALIICAPYTKPWIGADVTLYTGAEPYDFRTHQLVPLAPHRINGVIVFSAIFPALPSGPYRAFASGRHNHVNHVTIRPHEVVEIEWL